MGYNKEMFRRIAEELERIAYDVVDNNGEHVDEDDVFTAVNALGILALSYDDDLASLGLDLAACRLGGMYEVFQVLPDVKERLLEVLLEEQGYERFSSVHFDGYIMKDKED